MRMGKKRADRPNAEFGQTPGREPVDSKIEINERAGLIRVVDSRVFRPERREWCRALAEAAVARRGVEAVGLDLVTATCEIRFVVEVSQPALSARAMADVFAEVMGEPHASIDGPDRPRRRSSRRSPGWTSLTAFAGETTASIWEADRPREGSIRLRHQAFQEKRNPGPRLAADLKDDLAAVGICRFNRRARCLDVEFEPGSLEIPSLFHVAEKRLALLRLPGEEAVSGSERLPALDTIDEPSILVDGRTRPLYLALGCGAVAMSFVGLSVPGVPTVTFAVAAGYYLARSSIRLHGKVVRSRLFGPIVREWLARHGLSMGSKAKLIALTGGLVAVSFVLVPITPLSLAVTFVLSSGGVYSIVKMPRIEGQSDALPFPSTLPALPASLA